MKQGRCCTSRQKEKSDMTIYICGDSTAATYPPENAPITG